MFNYLGAKPITVKKGMERAWLPASVVTLPMKHPQKKESEFESETSQNCATTLGVMFPMASHNLIISRATAMLTHTHLLLLTTTRMVQVHHSKRVD